MSRRKLWTAALSMLLASSMVVSNVPVMGQTIAKEKFAKVEQKKDNLKAKYKEGEALVLYKQGISKLSAFNSKKAIFGEEIEVVNTWDFSNSNKVSKQGVEGKKNSVSIQVSLVKSAKYSTKELIKELSKIDEVAIAEPNYQYKASEVSEDPYKQYQWALKNQGQNAGNENSDIKADTNKLGSKETNPKERVIALVDTGIDYNHEELKNIVWNNPYTDVLKGKHGYDFINYDTDPLDDNGHGTHCSGIMAAEAKNGVGISGVATENNIKIMALKILDEDGYGYGDEAIGAYNYIYKAQQLGVNVVAVNNSWGGGGYSYIFEKLINLVGEQGAVSVCAAGNEYTDLDESTSYQTGNEEVIIGVEEEYISYPAGYDSDYIISVAATNEKDELAQFSNYGVKSVDLAAPGADILSTVSYDTFNPSIYADKSTLCSQYYDFSGKLVTGGSVTAGSIAAGRDIVYKTEGSNENNVSVNVTSDEYFGKKEANAKSLVWEIKGAEEGEYYDLYLPYQSEASDTPIYSSTMLRVEGPKVSEDDWWLSTLVFADGTFNEKGLINEDTAKVIDGTGIYEKSNYWGHLSGKVFDKVKKVEDRTMLFRLIIEQEGDYKIYIDDVATSKKGVTKEKFGKYEFYNGTSMAAPYVTGSVAAVSNVYPDADADELKACILGSVREVKGLEGKTGTGGVLDLSKIDNPKPSISSTKLNADNQIVINGNFFGKTPSITVNGAKANIIESNDKKIVLKSDGLLNKKVNVELTTGEYNVKSDFYLASGKDFEQIGTMQDYIYGGSTATDGNIFYYMDYCGWIYAWDPNLNLEEGFSDYASDDTEKYWNLITGEIDEVELFGKTLDTVVDYSLAIETDVIYADNKLWSIIRLDMRYAEEAILAYFDLATNKWVKASDLPKELHALNYSTLAAYDGQIYVIGGYDRKSDKASKIVQSFDSSQKTWNKENDIPEGRYHAKAMQAENKLVVTLGGSDSEGVPANLVFDGKEWKTGASIGKALKAEETVCLLDDAENATGSSIINYRRGAYKKLSYYTAQIGIIENGLIYTGLKADDLGDTFIYNLSSDKFSHAGYRLSDTGKDDVILATAIGDNFYTMTGGECIWNEYMGRIEYVEDLKISCIPVSGACIEVKQLPTVGGIIDGVKSYLPGQTITLTPIALYEDFFVKKFTVNGKVVSGSSFTTKASTDVKNILVEASFGMYVNYLFLNTEYEEVKAEKSIQLEAVVPEEADNKKILWTSSNEKYATVDSKGKVTAKKAGVGKTVIITATAKDRGTISAVCEIKIKAADATSKKVKMSKLKLTASKKTLKVGKTLAIKATISPKNATNKKVKWTVNKTKYASINSKGILKAKKAGKGKIVTVKATATDGSKVKATIKIRIK